jgi:NAD(P)-dependent dehydrogenase (short-subunit alcohol dehydrogenase family)
MPVQSLVWISGATAGIGWGLARTVPYPGARIINLSRKPHPDFETVQFDLTRPETYTAVQRHFETELRNFTGERAIFIHNAFYPTTPGFVWETDGLEYAKSIQANGAAPLILGEMFLRAIEPGYESGLVLMSSAAARHPFEGNAAYCAAKAGVEMWVRVVRRELERRGRKTWVVAVRPGFVDTPTTRMNAEQPADTYPVGPQMNRQFQTGEGVLTPVQAGHQIWSALPPKADTSLLLFGDMVKERD